MLFLAALQAGGRGFEPRSAHHISPGQRPSGDDLNGELFLDASGRRIVVVDDTVVQVYGAAGMRWRPRAPIRIPRADAFSAEFAAFALSPSGDELVVADGSHVTC